MQFVDLAAQQRRIRGRIDDAIKRVMDHGEYIMGPEVRELESRLADFVGVRHAIACSSGTDALLLALLARGVGPGDAVFTTPFTFFATCEVIALLGATPIFVDIEPATFNIDPVRLRERVDAVAREGRLRPRCIVPVDLFGLPARYEPILALARERDLFVVEDAAQAFGATCNMRTAPGLADIGVTSFFPAKPLGCYGDGGAVFTDSDTTARIVRSLLQHGKGPDGYDNVRIGLNARMDTMQAAILLEKLKIYPEEHAMRQRVARRYTDALGNAAPELGLPCVPDEVVSAWAQYTIRSPNRDALRGKLDARGIPTRIYYPTAIHLLGAMACLGGKPGDHPEAEKAAREVLSLPFHPYLSAAEQERVVRVIAETLPCRADAGL